MSLVVDHERQQIVEELVLSLPNLQNLAQLSQLLAAPVRNAV